MAQIVDYISVQTHGNCHIIDITADVARIIEQSDMLDGLVTVFVPGSTGAVTTIEYEPGLVKDLEVFLDRISPRNDRYHHDETWHDGNGHSHVRAAFLGPSLSVPLVDGRMTLGTWQQIVFIDLDNRPRSRELVIQIISG